MVAAHFVHSVQRINVGLVVVGRAQLLLVEVIARGSVKGSCGHQSGNGTALETREDVIRVAIDAVNIRIVDTAATVRGAHDTTEDIGKLKAFFEGVRMHRFGVCAADFLPAVDFPSLAKVIGVDGAVVSRAADGSAEFGRGEGVGRPAAGGCGARTDDERWGGAGTGYDDGRLR